MEYLFRGKRVDGKGWVYGYLAQNQGHSWILIPQEGIAYQCFVWEEVIPETVGQFTGFEFKQGQKIFSGDIVKTVALTNRWGERGAIVISKVEVWNGNVCLSITYTPLYPFCIGHDITVIGNIHDNKMEDIK